MGILFLLVMPLWGAEIHDAARKGNIDKVKALLAEKPELINAKDDDGNTPLRSAAAHAPGQSPPATSISLLNSKSLQVVASPCWKMALPDIISAILA